MTNQIDHIVEHLFDKKRFDEVSVYELERFIAMHPYFAAGHFLLAKKILVSHPERYKENISTTALYYNNPLWLQWLLDQDLSSYPKKQVDKEPPQNGYENVSGEQTADTIEPISQHLAEIITPTEQNSATPSVNESLQENEFSAEPETISDPLSTQQEEPGTHQQDVVPVSETNAIAEPEIEQQPEVELSQEDIPAANETEAITGDIQSDDSIQIPEEAELVNGPGHVTETVEFEQVSSDENQAEADVQHEYESTDPEQNKAEEESRASAASIGKTLTTAALIPTRAEIEKNEFTFEPYHTIDYFASQGIKLQQSDLSKDKFGKQLKSFTEWLRSMKRLPQASVEANMDEATQQSIQNIAEHSFEEKEIVTETMAEVWIKQGNKEKAIDTLHKLSLLNPSKSHYFAAKIEQLKAS